MNHLFKGLKLKKQRSTGDLDRKGVTAIRSTGSTTSWMSSESGYTAGASIVSEGSNQSFVMEVTSFGFLSKNYLHGTIIQKRFVIFVWFKVKVQQNFECFPTNSFGNLDSCSKPNYVKQDKSDQTLVATTF
jgi:hypothetical protein